MSKILNYFWRGWLVILGTVLTIVIGTPIYILSFNKKHYKYAYQLIRIWCIGLFYGMGFSYKLIRETSKKIDKNRQYIFISNHTSMVDVLLPCILMPNHPLCYVGKKELEKIPIFGQIYRRVCVMVDRSSSKSRAEVYKKCAERMAEGDSIVIFPEGGVPDDTSTVLDNFKDGAFILSEKHNAPILVFSFNGIKEMFPFDYGKGHPGTVKITFLDILEPNRPMVLQKEIAHRMIKNSLTK